MTTPRPRPFFYWQRERNHAWLRFMAEYEASCVITAAGNKPSTWRRKTLAKLQESYKRLDQFCRHLAGQREVQK